MKIGELSVARNWRRLTSGDALNLSAAVFASASLAVAPFPGVAADENDPASYDFANADMVLKRMRDAGTEPFYRLGPEYEGWLARRCTTTRGTGTRRDRTPSRPVRITLRRASGGSLAKATCHLRICPLAR